jgi:hypothetical protein
MSSFYSDYEIKMLWSWHVELVRLCQGKLLLQHVYFIIKKMFVPFLYMLMKRCFFWITLARFLFYQYTYISFVCWLPSNMVQGKGNLQQKTKWIKVDAYLCSIYDERFVSFARSYLEFNLCLAHLQCEFISWLTWVEFESFLQRLVQNNQCLLEHTFGSKIKLDTMPKLI